MTCSFVWMCLATGSMISSEIAWRYWSQVAMTGKLEGPGILTSPEELCEPEDIPVQFEIYHFSSMDIDDALRGDTQDNQAFSTTADM